MARQSYPPAPPPVDISGKEDIANKKSSLSDSEIFYPNVKAVSDAISGFEVTTNKKDTLADSTTDYPSSKAVYDALVGFETTDNKVTTLSNSDSEYPSTSAVSTALADKLDKVPSYELDQMEDLNFALQDADCTEFAAGLSANAALSLGANMQDGVTRYVTIVNYAGGSISITLPERFGSESPLEIENGFYGVIQFSYHLQIGKWFIIAQSFENIAYSPS